MNPNQLTLKQAVHQLNHRQLSSVELVTSCLDRINQTNDKINSFLTINPQALTQAKQADKDLIASKTNSKPLLGIPIAVKDNCLTQGLETTAASKVLSGFMPPFDATLVTKLKQAGAIIIGKTNMDAWAHGSSTETSDFGMTKNPWNLNHLPGGSSGGSAAAIAADQCMAAIGTETAGSIRQPSAWCGVTGFKPTYGRVSRYGVIAMASSTDSPGPITKDVSDASLLLKVIAGPDEYDATTIKSAYALNPDKISSSIKTLKIGIPEEYLLKRMDTRVIKLIHQAAAVFESLGAKIESTNLLDPKYAIGVYTILQRSEVSSNLARFDGVRYGQDRSFFGEEAKKRMLLGTYALSTGYYDQYYKKAQKVRTLIVEDFKQAFTKYDILLGPVSPGPALKVGASGLSPMFGELEDVLVEASSIAGLTGLSVPCGFIDGLPIGLQITADQQQEELVIKAGQAYQQATNFHTKRPNL